ncbi:MurR/RpiR family transcriptional regulator [Shinella sp.]|uniref:MurR/RpiR family transcriptional regulator n=1 Tax=Shinella sp. TaxID=1870904 RepID=UPI003F6EBE18
MTSRYPATTMAELRSQIISRQIVVPSTLETVARLAFDTPSLVAFESGNAFAKRSGIPPQAVTRLARSLGFKSFRDFRDVFRDHLREKAEAVRSTSVTQ